VAERLNQLVAGSERSSEYPASRRVQDFLDHKVSRVDEKERTAALRRMRQREQPRHDPVGDLPLAQRVIPPRRRHLDLPTGTERKCGAKARIETDTPFANIRNTVYCDLRKDHEGQHFYSDALQGRGYRLDGYSWS
jgi:hypothetical protein